VNQSPITIKLDHAAYALLNVPGGGARRVKLAVVAPHGTRAALALVGRTGGKPSGTAVVRLHELPHGGGGTVVVPAGSAFDRLTAVLVNSDTTQRGFSRSSGDWRYTKNRQVFYADASTDFTRPRVRTRTSSRTRVAVTFSERVRGVSGGSFELLDTRGHRVGASVKFNLGARRATLVPRALLQAGRRYRVRLTGAITDLALNPLRGPLTLGVTAR
jgi:hypothetical protein